jgi:hypothetical protein
MADLDRFRRPARVFPETDGVHGLLPGKTHRKNPRDFRGRAQLWLWEKDLAQKGACEDEERRKYRMLISGFSSHMEIERLDGRHGDCMFGWKNQKLKLYSSFDGFLWSILDGFRLAAARGESH